MLLPASQDMAAIAHRAASFTLKPKSPGGRAKNLAERLGDCKQCCLDRTSVNSSAWSTRRSSQLGPMTPPKLNHSFKCMARCQPAGPALHYWERMCLGQVNVSLRQGVSKGEPGRCDVTRSDAMHAVTTQGTHVCQARVGLCRARVSPGATSLRPGPGRGCWPSGGRRCGRGCRRP